MNKKYNVIAEDAKSIALFKMATKAAQSDINIMINGPSGSGKEVMARFIHEKSRRCNGPFVAVNCAAIPASMLESILFGHEKGAFTGATSSVKGKFEQANGGTLLLDEITEMPIDLQAKLLRAIQEKEIDRLGAMKSVDIDVRILATSNRQLKQAVKKGTFREDLYYRLNVFPIKWPELMDRPGDIYPLAQFFVEKYAEHECSLAPETQGVLLRYTWPGNVRELENVIQRALVLLGDEPLITSEAIIFDDDMNEIVEPFESEFFKTKQKKKEAMALKAALEQNCYNRRKASVAMGISERTMRYKVDELKQAGFKIPTEKEFLSSKYTDETIAS